jgi:hypothetical protein
MKSIKLLLTLLAFSVCTVAFASNKVQGNGKLTTKTITIADFNSIKIEGGADLIYSQNVEPSSVEVTVDQNLHQYVSIDVQNRSLTISFKGAKVKHFTKFIVRANSKWLRKAEVGGSGSFIVNTALTGDELDIYSSGNALVQLSQPVKLGELNLDSSDGSNIIANDIDVESLDCNIGSGTITIKRGKATSATCEIAGSGDLYALELSSPDISCRILGSGVARVNASSQLKARILGSGKVLYRGTPRLDEKVIGKGKVEGVR